MFYDGLLILSFNQNIPPFYLLLNIVFFFLSSIRVSACLCREVSIADLQRDLRALLI